MDSIILVFEVELRGSVDEKRRLKPAAG